MVRRSGRKTGKRKRNHSASLAEFAATIPIPIANLELEFDRRGVLKRDRVAEWNKEAERITGIKKKSIVGKPIASLLASADILNQLKEVSRSGKTIRLDNVVLRPGKKSVTIDVSTWKTDHGVGLMLHERNDVAASDDDFSQSLNILDSITDSFFLLDANWCFAFLSPKTDQFLPRIGLHKDDLLGKNMWDVIPDARQSAGYEMFQKALRDQTVIEFEEFYQPMNAWFGVHVHPMGSGLSVYVMDITRRKLTETAFLKLSNAVEQSADAVFVTNLDGVIEYVNPAFEQMTGYRRSEALGKTPRILRSDAQDEDFFKQMWSQVRSGETFRATVTNRHKTGRLYYAEETITPVREADGTITHFVASLVDITERKQTEKRFRSLIEHSSDGIALLAKDGTVTYSGPSTKKILGYQNEDFTGRISFNFVHRDDRTATEQAFKSLLEKPGQAITQHYRMRHRDGTWRWIEARANNLLDEPNVQSVVINYRDITDRKIMEEALRKSEIEYRNLFDRANDAIFIFEPYDETILEANDRACRLYGYTKEELLGMSLKQMTKDVARGETEIRELLKHQSSRNFETVHFDKDGTPMEMIVNSSVVEYAGRTAIMSIIRDITELRKLEHQLRQAQKMESVGTLAGGIAHDFNNILSIILGYTSLIKRGKMDSSRFSESIETITKAAQRGATLVKQILTFARKTDVVFESVKINELLLDLSKLLAKTFPETIDFNLQLDPNLPATVADTNQLHQVFLNLCVNARDAMPQGGVISLSTNVMRGSEIQKRFQNSAASEYIHIAVADTGTGMDPKTRSRVFEPFFTTKGQGRGTGLGLSVVYGIINNHHGFIDIESSPGKGTTFHLYLPVQMQRFEQPSPDLTVLETIPGGNETVLVVEDEHMLQILVQELLETHGYTVLTASDGIEAVDVYTQRMDHIHLVLTDIGLPRLSGWDVCRKIMALNPQANIIVASGYLDPTAKSDLKNSGAKDFLHKPYLPEDILKRIRAVLDRS